MQGSNISAEMTWVERGGLRDGSFPYAFLWMWVRRDFFRILFEDFYVFDWVRLFLRVDLDIHPTGEKSEVIQVSVGRRNDIFV
jgi:hypothetical protein